MTPGTFGTGGAEHATFLPEDYVEKRLERRTNVVAITLFSVVTLGVVGAFFVTHRQWSDVQGYQRAVNIRYAQAAEDIEQLKVLENRKSELLRKAELTTALIERAPRSILLAELINRMPKRATLLEFELTSKRMDKPVVARQVRATGAKKLSSRVGVGTSGEAGDGEEELVSAPRFETKVVLIGVAPSHRDIASYVAQLQECPLLERVELRFSEETIIRERSMNKFRIEADLRSEVDARSIEPLENPRLAGIGDPVEESAAATAAEPTTDDLPWWSRQEGP